MTKKELVQKLKDVVGSEKSAWVRWTDDDMLSAVPYYNLLRPEELDWSDRYWLKLTGCYSKE